MKKVGVQMNDGETNGGAPPQLPWEALGVACFWVAMKANGDRACLPSRTLLEKASGVAAASFTGLETVTATDAPFPSPYPTQHYNITNISVMTVYNSIQSSHFENCVADLPL